MIAGDVSVIVITCNRWDKLHNCLQCLEAQSVSGFEVIIVIDGSTDQTAAMLNKYTSRNFSLSVINKPNEGRSLSRNRGAKEATKNILVFFDDDMRPEPGCLAAHISLVGNNDDVISVGTQEEDLSQARTDFDEFRYHMTKKWEQALAGSQQVYLTSANFSISKKAFDRVGGFDRTTETVEDFEFGYRASKMAIRVVYNPKARAWHDNASGSETYIRKQIEYHRAHNVVARKHPELAGQMSDYKPGLLKRAVYNLVSRMSFVRLIDREYFKSKLPRAVRYKLYDVAITGLSKVYPNRFQND